MEKVRLFCPDSTSSTPFTLSCRRYVGNSARTKVGRFFQTQSVSLVNENEPSLPRKVDRADDACSRVTTTRGASEC